MKKCAENFNRFCTDYPEKCRFCRAFREPTNADRIRSMSDEELAEFLIDLADDGNLRIREWLKQPAK